MDLTKPLSNPKLERDVTDALSFLQSGSEPIIVLSALAFSVANDTDLEEAVRHAHRLLAKKPRDVVCRALVIRVKQLLAQKAEPDPIDEFLNPGTSAPVARAANSPMISAPGKTRRPSHVPDPSEFGEQQF